MIANTQYGTLQSDIGVNGSIASKPQSSQISLEKLS